MQSVTGRVGEHGRLCKYLQRIRMQSVTDRVALAEESRKWKGYFWRFVLFYVVSFMALALASAFMQSAAEFWFAHAHNPYTRLCGWIMSYLLFRWGVAHCRATAARPAEPAP